MADSNADKLRMALYRPSTSLNAHYDGTGILPTPLGVKMTRDEARSILADLERGERVEAAARAVVRGLDGVCGYLPDYNRSVPVIGAIKALESALGGGE